MVKIQFLHVRSWFVVTGTVADSAKHNKKKQYIQNTYIVFKKKYTYVFNTLITNDETPKMLTKHATTHRSFDQQA